MGERTGPDAGRGRRLAGPRRSARSEKTRDPTETARWFVPSTTHPVRTGNAVTAFTDGDTYFADLAASIRAVSGPDGFVELVNWDLALDFELIPGDRQSTPAALLRAASRRGVTIRALLNLHQSHPFAVGTVTGYDNSAAAALVNGLPHGAAIHDDRYLYAGTHHQKIAVVGSARSLVAYSGGMDLNPNRLANGTVRPRHDAQVRIEGPAALDHHAIIAARWSDHPASTGLPPLPTPPAPGPAGTMQVQVVTTYGNGTVRAGIGPGVGSVTPGYTFAPNGDRSVSQLVLHAISTARRFVYLEDQYLVNTAVSDALLAALVRIERLVILIADTPAVNRDLVQAWRRRKAFLDPLLQAAPGKVTVCAGRRHYIHSKLWVFDDEFAIVGSANCNRRGYSHDSEQAVGIVDRPGPDNWVHELRMRLWAKHLGLPPQQVRDPLAAAEAWSSPPSTADVAVYDPDGGTDNVAFPRGTDFFWDSLVDPAGS
jgi:phosphatidylserine/phosphatidylglycerophosphate/cardiolipin synthase-like enzyme